MKTKDLSGLTKEETKYSKFLAKVLRHDPSIINIKLDKNGWADVKELLAGFKKSGRQTTMEQLIRIVELNNKSRYEFNGDKTKIRARQGHSIDVDVELEEKEPPYILFHGTARRNIQGIIEEGLKPMKRKYVHLSSDYETALNVGSRHGEPLVLEVDAHTMYEYGYKFYLSRNGVWLIKDTIHPNYLKYAVM